MANGRDDRLDDSITRPKESIWNIRNIILILALGAIFGYGLIARDPPSNCDPPASCPDASPAVDGGRG